MDYTGYMVAFGVGLVIFIFGVKKSNYDSKVKEEEKKPHPPNDVVVDKNPADRIREQSAIEAEIRMERNKKIESQDSRFINNRDKFLENAEGGIDRGKGGQTIPEERLKISRQFSKHSKKTSKRYWELRDDEVILTDEQEEAIMSEFSETGWGWLIPSAVSFSDSGKMRLNYIDLFYIATDLKPIIATDGTLRVFDMLTLDSHATKSIMTGTSFWVKDEKKKTVHEITSDMVKASIHPLSIQELAEGYDHYKEAYEQSVIDITRLKGGVTVFEPLKEDEREAIAKSNEMIKKLRSQLKTVQDENTELKKQNSQHQQNKNKSHNNTNQKENKPNNNTHKNKNQNTQKGQSQNKPKFENAKKENIQNDGLEQNAVEVTTPQQVDQEISECDIKKFSIDIEQNASKMIGTTLEKGFSNKTGFVSIVPSSNSKVYTMYFEEKKFTEFFTEWATLNNCNIAKNNYVGREYYMHDENKNLVVNGKLIYINVDKKDFKETPGVTVVLSRRLSGSEETQGITEIKRVIEQDGHIPFAEYLKVG